MDPAANGHDTTATIDSPTEDVSLKGSHGDAPQRELPLYPQLVADELIECAQRVQNENEEGTAECLERLSKAIAGKGDVDEWSGIDLLQMVNPSQVATSIRTQSVHNRWLARAEWWRNFLILWPVLLTWLSLHTAVKSYQRAFEISPRPPQLDRPFLLLWQDGFEGLDVGGRLSWLTFSTVALLDVGIVAIIIMATVFIHWQTNLSQTNKEWKASGLERDLRRALWQASLILRGHTSEGALASQLRAEREVLEQLRDQYQTQVRSLSSFGTNFRKSAESLSTIFDQLRAEVAILNTSATELGGHIANLSARDETLAQAMIEMTTGLRTYRESQQQSVDQFRTTTERHVDSVKGTTEATNKLATQVEELGKKVATLQEMHGDYRDSITRLGQGATALKETLDQTPGVATQLTASATAIDSALKRFGDVVRTVDSAVSAQRDATRELSAATSNLANTTQSTQQSSAQLAAVARDVAPAVQGIRQATAAMNQWSTEQAQRDEMRRQEQERERRFPDWFRLGRKDDRR